MVERCFVLLLMLPFQARSQWPAARTPLAAPAPLAVQSPIAPQAPGAMPAATAQTDRPPRMVELPMLDCSGLPCLEMTTGTGNALRLLIDTGEINSYLDRRVAESLGLELHALIGGDGSAVSDVQQTVVPEARLGDLPMGGFPFMVLDTAPEADKPGPKAHWPPADGALTFSAFANRLLQLDYVRRVVGISEPQDAAQPCPRACSDLLIKRFGRFGPATLTARGFTLNGQSVEVQIDTLFTGTMLIYPASVEKLGLKRESKEKHKELFPFTQGGLKLVRADGVREGFLDAQLMHSAPVYFLTADEPAPSVQFDGTVGDGLFSLGVVTFDFKAQHMWMEPAVTDGSSTVQLNR